MKIIIDMGNDGIKIETVLTKDGDKWCVLAGENLQVGIAGFGSKIWQAISDFQSNFRNS